MEIFGLSPPNQEGREDGREGGGKEGGVRIEMEENAGAYESMFACARVVPSRGLTHAICLDLFPFLKWSLSLPPSLPLYLPAPGF